MTFLLPAFVCSLSTFIVMTGNPASAMALCAAFGSAFSHMSTMLFMVSLYSSGYSLAKSRSSFSRIPGWFWNVAMPDAALMPAPVKNMTFSLFIYLCLLFRVCFRWCSRGFLLYDPVFCVLSIFVDGLIKYRSYVGFVAYFGKYDVVRGYLNRFDASNMTIALASLVCLAAVWWNALLAVPEMNSCLFKSSRAFF